jgi:hypothetical protein
MRGRKRASERFQIFGELRNVKHTQSKVDSPMLPGLKST